MESNYGSSGNEYRDLSMIRLWGRKNILKLVLNNH
jgi:hypothetical protein